MAKSVDAPATGDPGAVLPALSWRGRLIGLGVAVALAASIGLAVVALAEVAA